MPFPIFKLTDVFLAVIKDISPFAGTAISGNAFSEYLKTG
jgi:hypothetical protein